MNGILVICAKAQEWMLPWWWMHYHFHNSLPAAVIDLGISEEARLWCAKRGEVIPMASMPLDPHIDVEKMAEWETLYTAAVWEAREKWFQKPRAMLHSPFEKTILIDLDAQVCTSLEPLFDLPLPPSGMALSENSTAVILFQKGSSLVQEWAEHIEEDHRHFVGDQALLVDLIQRKKHEVGVLPKKYNCSALDPHLPDMGIVHWTGPDKKAIRGSMDLCEKLLMNLSFEEA